MKSCNQHRKYVHLYFLAHKSFRLIFRKINKKQNKKHFELHKYINKLQLEITKLLLQYVDSCFIFACVMKSLKSILFKVA